MTGVLTMEEAAKYLRVHISTVYRLARRSEIPVVRVGRQWRVEKHALEKWMQGAARAELASPSTGPTGRRKA